MIPIKKGRKDELARKVRKLQRQAGEERQLIRNALRRARVYYVEKVNGNADALDEAKEQLAIAEENGMEMGAITLGDPETMIAQISAMLGRPESQSHAVGLLLNAADQTDDFSADKSAAIRAIADSIDGAENAQYWRDISTIRIETGGRV